MSGVPGLQSNLEHAIWLVEHGVAGSAGQLREQLRRVDEQLRLASTTEATRGLTVQRKRLTEAASRAGVELHSVRESMVGDEIGPKVQDFVEVGLTEVEAASAVVGLQEGRFLSFEDAFWSTSIFESKRTANQVPDPAKLRAKARKFAGARLAEVSSPTTTPWGRPVNGS